MSNFPYVLDNERAAVAARPAYRRIHPYMGLTAKLMRVIILAASDTTDYPAEYPALRGLMTEEQPNQFSASVGKLFSSEDDEVRDLWLSVAQQYDSVGPDAAREHLTTERQRIEERIKRLLGQI